jgi:hypothetical protein
MGLVEYFYNVKNPVISSRDMGRIEGEWQYQFVGSNKWSLPLSFYGVKQGITIPLDPSCNCYPINGKVNGYAVPFIVDTGAAATFLDLDDACGMGLCDYTTATGLSASKCDQTSYTCGGVGGTITCYRCFVDISVEDRILIKDVESYLAQDAGIAEGLLGMTFLDKVNTSVSSADGTMTIAP